MGVSKGEEGGRWSPPNGWRSLVLGEGGPCRIWRSGGFPNFPGKSSPSSPSSLLFTPFSPPSTLSSNFSTSQTPSSNSLEQATISPPYLFHPFFLTYLLPTFSRSLSGLLRTPSESLYMVPQKALFRPF